MKFSDGFWEQFNEKKVVCYGADATGMAFIYYAEKTGIKIAYFVDRSKEKQRIKMLGLDVKDPFDLMYENADDLKIVITAPVGRDAILRTLQGMGFILGKQIVDQYLIDRFGEDNSCIDAMLGLSRGENIIYKHKACRNLEDSKVIMISGGSTTDPCYLADVPSWTFYLQELLDRDNISAQIINIAEKGYTSAQELLSLIREGISEMPDIFISYSGYNDIATANDIKDGKHYEYTSRNIVLTFDKLLNNIRKEEKFPDIYMGKLDNKFGSQYIVNMRIMNAICKEFSCQFIGILQPSLLTIPRELMQSDFAKRVADDVSVQENRKRWMEVYRNYKEELKKYSYLYDFTNILNENDDVFEDVCHVNESGNRIIAQKVFELLKREQCFDTDDGIR